MLRHQRLEYSWDSFSMVQGTYKLQYTEQCVSLVMKRKTNPSQIVNNRLLDCWSADEGSQEEQARLYTGEATG